MPSRTFFLPFLLLMAFQLPLFGCSLVFEEGFDSDQSSQFWLARSNPEALEVLRFWFEEWDADMEQGGAGRYNEKWFPHGPNGLAGSQEIDRLTREKFLSLFEFVVSGQHDWDIHRNPFDNLAYIILIDQFSRNMFRNQGRAFRYDGLARDAAKVNLEKQFHKHYFTGYQKLFVIFPMMHHENLASQQVALDYLKALNEHPDHPYEFLNALNKAFEHYQMVYMFGRFPHRNQAKHRISTALEEAYLSKKGTKGFIDGASW
ncbi:DUF924 family protein [Endozoicomonas atrinae]|uniref:DUF924 family protein n=1 Tax=Endozoicomonas atrinae TaxID=1333660 RepID=UPI0008251CB9|nr:DUF924 family protein [Endozoicomonas atrinae]